MESYRCITSFGFIKDASGIRLEAKPWTLVKDGYRSIAHDAATNIAPLTSGCGAYSAPPRDICCRQPQHSLVCNCWRCLLVLWRDAEFGSRNKHTQIARAYPNNPMTRFPVVTIDDWRLSSDWWWRKRKERTGRDRRYIAIAYYLPVLYTAMYPY